MKREPHAVPRVKAEVTFLRADEGGRKSPPSFTGEHQYMPHIVVQPRHVRRASVSGEGSITDLYEGVAFVERPTDYEVGTAGTFTFDLMYYPADPYDLVQRGATFTVREGGRIVAHGVVLERRDPPGT